LLFGFFRREGLFLFVLLMRNKVRIEFLHAVRADAVAELRLGMALDVTNRLLL
jgi:hypothetical protein